jgi:hypothetical protein
MALRPGSSRDSLATGQSTLSWSNTLASRSRETVMINDGDYSVSALEPLISTLSPDELLRQLESLVEDAQPDGATFERRNYERVSVSFSFTLMLIDETGSILNEDVITAVAQDVSISGLGFTHKYPLSSRWAILTLKHSKRGHYNVVAEIVWTRQVTVGLHESGCQFVYER